MGKNGPIFQLPGSPSGAIQVLTSYGEFFRAGLLRAVRADFEDFGGGLPTYHKQITSLVEKHAGGITRHEALSLKDLANFLKGMRSHTARVAVLDAYIQLVNPKARRRFFVETMFSTLAESVGDYLSPSVWDPYDRQVTTQKLVGTYKLDVPRQGNWGHRDPDRYLVIRRSDSGLYLLRMNSVTSKAATTTTFKEKYGQASASHRKLAA